MSAHNFIDAHCHLADPRFDGQREAVMERAKSKGIQYFLQGGIGPEDWDRQVQLNDGSWLVCFGLHPWFVNENDETTCETACAQLKLSLGDAVALGECGLDFGPRMAKESYSRQIYYLEQQLLLARNLNKPIVLHAVRCHGPMLRILKEHGGEWRGIVHGFSGSFEVAREFLALGLDISLGPALSRGGYQKVKDAVSRIPLERLVVESDAPDMAPTGWDLPLNEPSSLWQTANAIAAFHQTTAEDVLSQSRHNLCRTFELEI